MGVTASDGDDDDTVATAIMKSNNRLPAVCMYISRVWVSWDSVRSDTYTLARAVLAPRRAALRISLRYGIQITPRRHARVSMYYVVRATQTSSAVVSTSVHARTDALPAAAAPRTLGARCVGCVCGPRARELIRVRDRSPSVEPSQCQRATRALSSSELDNFCSAQVGGNPATLTSHRWRVGGSDDHEGTVRRR